MRISLAAVSLFAALSGAASSAHAGVAGVVQTQVAPLSGQVTYSKASSPNPFYIGYQVTITNIGTNTVNNVNFYGWTTVTDPDESAPFSQPPANDATCAPIANPAGLNLPANARSIACALGQMRAGGSVTFTVFFNAPQKDTATPTPDGVATLCATTDCVGFNGFTAYSEGGNDSSQSSPNDSNAWAAAPVLLGTPDPTVVKSAVPKSGGRFFTGSGVSSTADPFTTSVTVPSSVGVTLATISESVLNSGCINFQSCYQSDLTIPAPPCTLSTTTLTHCFAPYLTIVLRQDASNIKPGTKIQSVVIQYVDEFNNSSTVVDCLGSPPQPRTDGQPCIAARVYYKNKSVPGWTPDLDGDFEWTLLNLKNGAFKLF
jgi:hypothetical protein